MMLFKNDILLLNGSRHRLLHVDPPTDKAWVISIDDAKEWPREISWQYIAKLEPYAESLVVGRVLGGENEELQPESRANFKKSLQHMTLKASPAMFKTRDQAIGYLGNLANQIPAIFDKSERCRLIHERTQEVGCSIPTLYKHLRQFWVGGQTPSALLGNFHRCGRTEVGFTAGRGAKPKFGRSVYQLTERDFSAFEAVIKVKYLKDSRWTMTKVYQYLLEQHYQIPDGNGDMFVVLEGERPTFKQFEYFLRKQYSLEVRLRGREGDKDFERDHRAVLGTVLADCLGVGHYYEADATIADVYLVATEEIRKIVGKPTIYLIIDRKSRLIVGWYVGLENASWICAMQAMLSISQDKQQLCARLGVKYDPQEWPAHQVFPKEFLADRSELLTKTSNQISSELAVTVTNVPSKRADWKPVVECGFKQTRMILQDGTPGFDPPENAKKRQGKHFEKDACLTLRQFEAIVLLSIIAHNRCPLPGYALNLKEIGNDIEPVPIALWNHDIVERAGVLPRFSEDRVRMALLPRDEATVSEEGILFGSCHYTCKEALAGEWFVTGRKRRFKVTVSFDGRLVDTIYVHDPNHPGSVYKCNLTSRSDRYVGLSFNEVKALEKFGRMLAPSLKQSQIQVTADFHRNTKPIIDSALKKLKSANLNVSRKARREDTKAARIVELRTERQELATESNPTLSETPAKVISISTGKIAYAKGTTAIGGTSQLSEAPGTQTGSCVASAPSSAMEKLDKIKQRMFHG